MMIAYTELYRLFQVGGRGEGAGMIILWVISVHVANKLTSVLLLHLDTYGFLSNFDWGYSFIPS